MIVAENYPNAASRQASGGTKKDLKLITKSRQVAKTEKQAKVKTKQNQWNAETFKI